MVEDQETTYFLAGDTSCDERLMLAGRIDGVSADNDVAGATLRAIRQRARDRQTVYGSAPMKRNIARVLIRVSTPASSRIRMAWSGPSPSSVVTTAPR
jgi:hypothetical protein